jgi:hypothetical protein
MLIGESQRDALRDTQEAMSAKPSKAAQAQSGPITDLAFFDQLAWAVPTAFASALAAYRFEPGDVLYPEPAAYDALEGALPAPARAIQVLRSARSTRATPAESGSSRRRSSWESEVEIELVDLATGSAEGRVVSQGKLLMTLWRGDESWLDPEREEPPLPRSARELASQIEEAREACEAHQSTQKGCRFVFVVDLASDASRVKAASVEQALAALGALERIDLPPRQAGVEDPDSFHPALVLRAILVRGASLEQMEQALRGALYAGGSAAAVDDDEAESSDRFSVARHGLLEGIGG